MYFTIPPFNCSPVDDAMPERLPHARLTATGESLDLFDCQKDLRDSYTEKLIAILGPTVKSVVPSPL